ncbi:armadillo repeat-containing protein 8-like [Corticium candelabrum]|uniref:armadillo repeat-containing protein 8-like n=1 Tax=Corticium candelabrum TaxID=121492 RepID=UPI002E270EAC|nr:armadillo repeat-containing protein 8-like [Corticium candelabrum]
MIMETEQNAVDALFDSDPEVITSSVRMIKNSIIGSRSRKCSYMSMGVIPRLVHLIGQNEVSSRLVREAVVALGSFAHGTPDTLQAVIDSHAIPLLLRGLFVFEKSVVEACMKTLKIIYQSDKAPGELVYEDPSVLPRLVQLLSECGTFAECAAIIMTKSCVTNYHQITLCAQDIVSAISPLLTKSRQRCQVAAVMCLSAVVYQNQETALAVAQAHFNGDSIPILIKKLLTCDQRADLQLWASKCLCYLFRAQAIPDHESTICVKVVPTLVRLSKSNHPVVLQADAIETLAFVIHDSPKLQELASITDRLIFTLAEYLHRVDLPELQYVKLRRSCFLALAALTQSLEDIRQKVIGLCGIPEHLVSGLEHVDDTVKDASLRCFLSLSRSVRQLRSSLKDENLWKLLLKLLAISNSELLCQSSAVVSNIILDFSPAKELLVQERVLSRLIELTRHEVTAIRVNAVWSLMNAAYHADSNLKNELFDGLGASQLFSLMRDSCPLIVVKSLCLLRNLTTDKLDVDSIMSIHGEDILHHIREIIEESIGLDVTEQALCVLVNIASSKEGRNMMMRNENLIKHLSHFINTDSVQLQSAAVICVLNLALSSEEGATERQVKLEESGVKYALQRASKTQDTCLMDRVKVALEQFDAA